MSTIDDARQASNIVSELLLHFGVGYGIQSQLDSPNELLNNPKNDPIMSDGELQAFHDKLFKNALVMFASWAGSKQRTNALNAAFWHGVYARQQMSAQGHALNATTIAETLEKTQRLHCPSPDQRNAKGPLVDGTARKPGPLGDVGAAGVPNLGPLDGFEDGRICS